MVLGEIQSTFQLCIFLVPWLRAISGVLPLGFHSPSLTTYMTGPTILCLSFLLDKMGIPVVAVRSQ